MLKYLEVFYLSNSDIEEMNLPLATRMYIGHL